MRVGIVGDYDPDFVPHVATSEAIDHVAAALGLAVDVDWVPTPGLERRMKELEESGELWDGLWIAPGSPYRSMAGALAAIEYARTRGIPLLGTCGGFQHVVVEYARNVLGFADAAHAEYDPYASELFVSELTCSLAGQRMEVSLVAGSRTGELYGRTEVEEEYYCNFGLNPEHRDLLHRGGLLTVGSDADGEARILELPDHPFYIATLFVPPLTSTPEAPHPVIAGFLAAS